MLKVDKIPLFLGTSAAFRQEVERSLRWKTVGENQELVNREDPTSEILFVQQGLVRVIIYTASGREIVLDDIPEGGFFGEIAAIDKKPRSATVFSVKPSVVGILPGNKFEEFLKKEPLVGFRIMTRLASMIRTATLRIVDLSTLGANNRIHAEILRLGIKQGVDKDGKVYITPIPLHNEIASRVSTVRETVARAMNDLARKKIVTRDKRTLIIHDIKKLSDMVEEVRGGDIM